MFKPEHPTTAYEGFVKQVIRALASGLEVSYNSLSSDLEAVNFSSIRSGTLEERDNWKAVQGWFIEDCCEQIWLPWLEMAVMTQQLPYSIYDLGRLNACKWQGRSWSWVDPLKDQKANSEGIATGLSTRTDIANEQGKDFFEMIDTIAEEEKYIKEKGLTFVFPGKGTAQPPEGKPNEPVTPTGEQPTGEPKGVDAAAAKMKVIDGGKRSLDIAEENEGG
jgi:lambda family phage portal protein